MFIDNRRVTSGTALYRDQSKTSREISDRNGPMQLETIQTVKEDITYVWNCWCNG